MRWFEAFGLGRSEGKDDVGSGHHYAAVSCMGRAGDDKLTA